MPLCELLVTFPTEYFLESAVRLAEFLLELSMTFPEFVNYLAEILFSAGFFEVKAVARGLQGSDGFAERSEINADG
jgi:hypothetical protein